MKGDKGEDYIVGGHKTKELEHPWQVGLVLKDKQQENGKHPLCGGTLISSTHVITAAHCLSAFSASHIEVLLGEHNVADKESNRVKVNEIIKHPDYEPYTDTDVDHDYAILRLAKPVSFTKKVRPACLPDDLTSTYEGTVATVTGWGHLRKNGSSPDVLQEVDVKVMTNAKCESDHSKGDITKNMLCASAPGKDSCQGDSGGPLIAPENGRKTLIGIVSWGRGCAKRRRPGVFARVTEQMDWILDNTAGTFSSTCKALN